MNDIDQLLDADRRRCDAMVAADIETLTNLLDKDLSWTHSSGRNDSRTDLLEILSSGSVKYKSLDISEANIQQVGDTFVYTGIVRGEVLKEGTTRQLQNRFLSVWVRKDNQFSMLAWQSTGI